MNSPTLHYQLSIFSWQQHLFDVTLTVPSHKTQTLNLTLPSWIPGSYMVRDFAKNIVSLSATNTDTGDSINCIKTDKQTWQANTQGQALTITYRVYANDLSVRSAFINDEYAFINGTSAFLSVEGFEERPCKLQIIKPAITNWRAYTSMPLTNDVHDSWEYEVKDYAEFIDHPIYIGVCNLHSFDVDGVTFELLFSGRNNLDLERIANDLTPICRHHMQLFGDPQPMQRYLFMTLLADTGFGGLEHRDSTALLFPRFDLPMVGESETKTDGYITFLSLCSHELFHTWHVKRIKPEVMVKPDLQKETYTNQLWIYEGFTSFYDDVTLARAGTITPQKYLDIVSQNLTRLLQNAGRFKQSVAESSFDAWTKFYKQDASATNSIVSYYTKGGIIAFGLDLLLREKSNNDVTLDSLMRHLWEQYGRDEKGTPDDVIAAICEQDFNIDISDYLADVVYGTKDVPLENWLSNIGVELLTRSKVSAEDKGGKTSGEGVKRQLGANCKPAPLGLTVTQVFEGLAASDAGLMVNDTIIAVNGYVVNQVKLQRILDSTNTGQVSISLIRDGRLLTGDLDVRNAREDVCYFSVVDESKLAAWLGLSK
ncbi:M61 family peptidase [Alteromonas sp. 1_MG-2023]|uniref:M61 family metallopeptidase n=1 Tax=Alteromonas sp. 1_MG-2023 TaxID=3062669 RepID=UPI0026E46562|nr:PDZ domain-containing protein [Alteromonas sp. 1_MG-2023]MDO6565939.1 M61 family peptidase [Alteromonas sp. 1_MG-2023]